MVSVPPPTPPSITDWIGAIGTCFAAIGTFTAVLYSMIQSRNTRKDLIQSRMDSLKPLVCVSYVVPAFQTTGELQQLSFSVINVGVGPALSVTIEIENYGETSGDIYNRPVYLQPGVVGDVRATFDLPNPPKSFNIRIRYASVFSETFFSVWKGFSVSQQDGGKVVQIQLI